eukprot:6482529-Amphidinium_carterae.5
MVYTAEDHNEYAHFAHETAYIDKKIEYGFLWNNVNKAWRGMKQVVRILLSILHFCNEFKRKPIQTTSQVIQRHETDAQMIRTWWSHN